MKMRVSSSKTLHAFVLVAIPVLAFFLTLLRSNADPARKAPADTKPAARNVSAKTPGGRGAARVLESYAKLPLAFERNMGQSDAQVKYLSRGKGYEVFLTPKEAVLALWQLPHRNSPALVRPSDNPKASVLRLQLAGANPSSVVEGMSQLDRKVNYFIGNDPKNWIGGVPSYERVEYKGIYPGVDLAFYGQERRLEYDFVVSPGADPKAIALQLVGSKKTHIDSLGNLVVSIPAGEVSFQKPVIYQTGANGERREIAGGYQIGKNGQVEFAVAEYDHSRTLVIDPVLDYSTYVGGSSVGDSAQSVAVDGAGNAFVTGQTFDASFPLTGSPATTVGLGTPNAGIATNGGAFVSEIDPTGTKELYFSYLSGDGGEVAYSVAVDPAANTTCMNGVSSGYCVYITGQTFSDNFPVASVVTPYNATAPTGGAPTVGNAFISKLNPYVTGSTSLLYSSYLASTNFSDVGHGITVDSSQDAYITGFAASTPGAVPNFPILNGAQATLPNAAGNAFLTVLNTTASSGALLYSTYLGGNDAQANPVSPGGDIGWAVAVDASKIAYIVGTTGSTNFPNMGSTGTFPNIKGWLTAAPNGNATAFVAAINTTLSGVNSLVYATYVGGTNSELGNAIALAGSGVVYITGQTTSTTGFPVTQPGASGQFPSAASSAGVAFITALNTTANGAPTYSALLGGNSADQGNGIAIDTLGNVIVSGQTQSSNFPITPGAFKTALSGAGQGDAFITKVNPSVSGTASLLYSTYFGGSGVTNLPDQGLALALDSSGNAVIAGQTHSLTDFPTSSGAFETSGSLPVGTVQAGFVAKLTLLPVLAFGSPCAFNLSVTPATSCALAFGSQLFHIASAAQLFTLTNNTGSTLSLTIPLPAITGTNAADFAAAAAASGGTPACTTSLAAGASCAIGVTFTPSTSGTAETASLPVTYTYNNGTSTPAAGTQTVALSGTGTSPTVVLSPTTTLNFATSQPVGTTSSAQSVTVTNNGTGNLTFTSAPSTGSTEFVVASGTTCTTSSPVTPTSSCIINITFTPSASGARSATLTIADNATGSPQTLSLTGTGIPTAPVASVTPLSLTLTFSSQTVNTTSAAQTVTVTNTGNANLNITAAPSISGTNAADFAVASGTTCTNGAAVAPTASCIINITFTPSAAGSRSAALTIADNAAGSPQTLTLTGTGAAAPVATVTPAAVAFTSQTVNTTSAAQAVTVKNTGNANLNITAAASLSGANAADFAIAAGTTCTNGAAVAPNATCVINITFTPSAAGARSATLSITDNAAGSPQTLGITGTAVAAAPVASVAPTTVAAGGQLVTTTSTAQVVTVTNTGNASLNITAAPSISGANAADFAVASGTTCTSGATVAANASCVINITFTPPAGASGSQAATLTITDNAAGSPQTVPLTGTAWDFTLSGLPVTLNPGASGTIAVTVTGVGGFTGGVTLTCSASIPGGSCSAPSSAVTAPGTGNVTIVTKGLLVPPTSHRRPPISMQQIVLAVFGLMLLLTLPVARRFRTRLGLAGAAALLIVAAGCSNAPPTGAGIYPVTITGTSGALSHSITVNVTVN